MATYVGLINFTEQGIRGIQDSPSRSEAFKRKADELGVTIKDLYWTAGDYDGILIAEAADDATVSALLLWLARAGNVRTRTLRAFDRAEMEAILAKSS